jgi:YVTN family beta-propeller protein
VGAEPFAIGVNPSTGRVYVANVNSDTVSVIDGATNTVVATVAVGNYPTGVGVNPSTDRVYVANMHSDTVSVIAGPSITLDPPTATNEIGSDHTVTATVTDGLGFPVQEADVEFHVTDGPNAGDTGSDSTDVNGAATFAYTGDGGAGTDTIEACAVVVDFPEFCTTATKTWVVEPTPTPTPTPTPLAATATPTPTPVVLAVALPSTGGTPSDGSSSALPWLVAIAGAIALIGSGSAWFAHQRQRAR